MGIEQMKHRDLKEAFNDAIKAGNLTTEPYSETYAGNYMYMHTIGTSDYFKHIDTREYKVVHYNKAIQRHNRSTTHIHMNGQSCASWGKL